MTGAASYEAVVEAGKSDMPCLYQQDVCTCCRKLLFNAGVGGYEGGVIDGKTAAS